QRDADPHQRRARPADRDDAGDPQRLGIARWTAEGGRRGSRRGHGVRVALSRRPPSASSCGSMWKFARFPSDPWLPADRESVWMSCARMVSWALLYAVALLAGRATALPETGLALFW